MDKKGGFGHPFLFVNAKELFMTIGTSTSVRIKDNNSNFLK